MLKICMGNSKTPKKKHTITQRIINTNRYLVQIIPLYPTGIDLKGIMRRSEAIKKQKTVEIVEITPIMMKK